MEEFVPGGVYGITNVTRKESKQLFTDLNVEIIHV